MDILLSGRRTCQGEGSVICDTSIVRFNNLLPVEQIGGLSKVVGVVRMIAGNEMITRDH